MNLKKRAMTLLAIASLLIANTNIAQLTSANTLPPSAAAFYEEGTKESVTATCTNAQEIINDIQNIGEVTLIFTENCNMSLTIPSGKKIILRLDAEDKENPPYWYGSDNNITVDEGALLYLQGQMVQIQNNTEGKAIIDNKGTTYLDGAFYSMDGSYTAINSGELNILNGHYDTPKFQNLDSGKIRIAGGAFNNLSEIKDYAVGEPVRGTEEWVGVVSPRDIPYAPEDYDHMEYEQFLPVNSSIHINASYPDYQDAYGAFFRSSDESILKVTGSNQEGWTFTVVNVGTAELLYYDIRGHYTRSVITSYENMPPESSIPAITCAEAQAAIDGDTAPNGNFTIIENCTANLIIPSGKNISFALFSEEYSTRPSEEIARTFYTLTNNGGDTITIQEGAHFFKDAFREETISNSTSGKSIINNQGEAYILEGTYIAENGAYTFTNSGELNILGGKYIGFSVNNIGTGKIRIIGGTFDNIEAIRPYIADGAVLNEETGEVTFPQSENNSPLRSYHEFLTQNNEHKFPVGYSFSVKSDFPAYANALGATFSSSDDSIIKVTGSNDEGWTFAVVGAGQANIYFNAIYQAAVISVEGYAIQSSIQDDISSLITQLISSLTGFLEKIQDAIKENKTISVELTSDALNSSTIDEAAKSAIEAFAGDDHILGYYDINLALKGDDEELAKIRDLEDKDVAVRIPAGFLSSLTPVADGYKRNYYAIRYHDSVAEKLNAYLINNDHLVFRSNKFSLYAIAYNDTPISTTPPAENNPNTGDNTNPGTNTGNTSGTNTGSSTSGTGNTGTGSNTSTDAGSSNTNSSTNNNTNSTNSNNNSNSNAATSNPENVTAPNTGILAYLEDNKETVITIGTIALAFIGGVVATRLISKKRRRW